MKLLLLLCISLISMSTNTLRISELARKTISPHHHAAWAEWKEKYFAGDNDTSCDNADSMKQWEKNKDRVDNHNKNEKKGKSSFKEACNEFCCKSSDEMADDRGAKVPDSVKREKDVLLMMDKSRFQADLEESLKDIPITIFSKATQSSVDWKKAGMETPVKNQKGCGSCWAFAVQGVVEAAFRIKGGAELDTSEQALVDCDKSNNGCNGGWMSGAINFSRDNGVFLEKDYGYTAKNGSCKKGNYKAVAGYTVQGYGRHTGGEDQLKAAVQKQPVTVAVNASKWHLYSNGIVDDASWCSGGVNHAVNVVGYGTDGGVDYWLIRNSWGTGWGESGYIRLNVIFGGFISCSDSAKCGE